MEGSVAVAQLTTAKPVELSWKWPSQADGSAFQTPRLGLAWEPVINGLKPA